jgi:hypothetical protein
MNLDTSNMSVEGATAVFETVAFNMLRNAVSKATGDIFRERKAAEQRDIDAFSDLKNTEREEDAHDEVTVEQGNTPKLTFMDNCRLAGLANDALETLANGGKYPRAQNVANCVDYVIKQTTGNPGPNDIEVARAMVKADTGQDISDEDLLPLIKEEADRTAAFFAARTAEVRDEVIERIEHGIVEARVNNFGLTFETAFANLPDNVQLAQLNAIDRKLEYRIAELRSGKKRDGTPAPVGKIPAIHRVPMVALLRGDQRALKAMRVQLAHAA